MPACSSITDGQRYGQKLVVRTWSSGVPHWLEDQWVHAPGYDHFGGSGEDLWKRVFRDLPADIIIRPRSITLTASPTAVFAAAGQGGSAYRNR
jgi:hypothetical protein